MGNQHSRKAQPATGNRSEWTMRWESASRDRRTTVRQLAAGAALTALLVLVFAGAAGKQPLAEAPPPAAQQLSTAIPPGAAVQLTGDPADLVSWLEQVQASATAPTPAAPDPADLVHWLEQFQQGR